MPPELMILLFQASMQPNTLGQCNCLGCKLVRMLEGMSPPDDLTEQENDEMRAFEAIGIKVIFVG